MFSSLMTLASAEIVRRLSQALGRGEGEGHGYFGTKINILAEILYGVAKIGSVEFPMIIQPMNRYDAGKPHHYAYFFEHSKMALSFAIWYLNHKNLDNFLNNHPKSLEVVATGGASVCPLAGRCGLLNSLHVA